MIICARVRGLSGANLLFPVSYTHLDVYKRQGPTLGEGGLGGTDGHGQGLAVADGCDGVALVADFGTRCV